MIFRDLLPQVWRDFQESSIWWWLYLFVFLIVVVLGVMEKVHLWILQKND